MKTIEARRFQASVPSRAQPPRAGESPSPASKGSVSPPGLMLPGLSPKEPNLEGDGHGVSSAASGPRPGHSSISPEPPFSDE